MNAFVRSLMLRFGLALGVIAALAMTSIPGCPRESHSSCTCSDTASDPVINPDDFVELIDNPYFPQMPGTTKIYEASTDEGLERTVIQVLHETKEILGVNCTIVRDTVTLEDTTIEDTYDWFAQDKDGNVWYFGEASMEFDGELVTSTFGSWEAGVHCAKPGIVMLAGPVIGQTYQQEYYACVAEDSATVLALDASVKVKYGEFKNCVKTFEYTPLDASIEEKKLYAPGVGHVLTIEDGARAEELVSVTSE